jgi:uncharacterized protein YebE (UPF0316 family)
MPGFDVSGFLESSVFTYVLVPLLIFAARICDVSIGTLRTVFVTQGSKGWAAVLGFFEVLIWLTVITYILQNLTSVTNYLAYAAGFGAGNYVGLRIEEKIARGLVAVTTITNHDAKPLIDHLKNRRYGLTSVSATGTTGRVRLILSVVRRSQFQELREIIQKFHPSAFIAVQPVRSVSKELGPGGNFSTRFFDVPLMRKSK